MSKVLQWRTLVVMLVLVGFVWQGWTGYAQAEGDSPSVMEPLWTTGQITDTPGKAGILVTDLDGDGSNETVACGATSPFALKPSADSSFYYSLWYGERLACSALAVADADGDGIQEIYVGSDDPFVYIYSYNGSTYVRSATITLPETQGVAGITVGNVDNDDDLEIVVTRTTGTLVYNAETYALEWNATGFGGTGVAIANIKAPLGKQLIIVNGADGYYLDAVTQTLDGSYLPSFGTRMAVANLDADAFAEIAWHSGNTLSVLDADTATVKWSLNNGSTQWLTIGNVDATPELEVVTGASTSQGAIRARNGSTGTQVLTFNNQFIGTYGLAVGDTDDDNVPDVVWGTRDDSGVGYSFVVASIDATNNQFIHPVWDTPWQTAAGDIDNDGTTEIVVVPRSSGVDFYGGSIAIFDSETFEFEGNVLTSVDVWDVEVAQLDDDPALEIALAGVVNNSTTGRVMVYDGITRAMEWQNGFALGTGPVNAIAAANIDGDAWAELALVTAGGRFYVLDGRSNTIQYQNTAIGGAVLDVEIGNADGDAALEIAAVTSSTLHLFQTDGWTQTSSAIAGGTTLSAVAFGNDDSTSDGKLLVVGNNTSTSTMRFLLLDGDDFTIRQDALFGTGRVEDIIVADVDNDNANEYIVSGQLDGGNDPSLLQVYDYTLLTSTLAYTNDELWGNIEKLTLATRGDHDDPVLVLGSTSLVQMRYLQPKIRITPTPTTTNTATVTPTGTQTATPVATSTATATVTQTAQNTATPTATTTQTTQNTVTPTATATQTAQNTATPSATATQTAQNTATPTATPTNQNPADIYVDPAAVAESHFPSPQVTTETVTLGNAGMMPLTWSLVEDDGATVGGNCSAPTDIPWLTVNPTSGTVAGNATTPLTLTFNSATLPVGFYDGVLCITSNDPDEPVLVVPVSLDTRPPTAVTLSEWRVDEPQIGGIAALGLGLLAIGALWGVMRRRA